METAEPRDVVQTAELSSRRTSHWRGLTALVAVAAAVLAITTAAQSRSWDPSCYAGNRCDALTFRLVGDLLATGRSPYPERARREVAHRRLGSEPPFDLPFQYPPHALPLFGALRRLWASDAGELAWAGVTSALFAVAVGLLFGHRPPSRAVDYMFIATTLSGFVVFNAYLGQTGAIVGAIVAVAIALWADRPLAAGAFVGLATLKPQYAVPLLAIALVRREWRVVAGAAIVAAALALLSAAEYGLGPWRDYPAALRAVNLTLPFMVSWAGAVARVTGMGVPPAITIAVYAVAVVAVVWGAVARPDVPTRSMVAVALAWCLAASPNTHPYDLTLLAPALALLAVDRGERRAFAFLALSWFGLQPQLRWLLFLMTVGIAVAATRTVQNDRRARLRNG